MSREKRSKAGPGQMTIRMSDAGMTSLHRAGLAGLWMTLESFDAEPALAAKVSQAGEWQRKGDSVTLSWKAPERFFKDLFVAAFRVDDNGLIWFPGLGNPLQSPEQASLMQEALLYTFLQHGKTRKAEKAEEATGSLSFEVGDQRLPLRFRKVKSYRHQTVELDLRKPNRVPGWLFPGGAERHIGFPGRTVLHDDAPLALALRFAPVGVFYLRIKSRLRTDERSTRVPRARFALVIPEIRDLEAYAEARRVFVRRPVSALHAAGTEEAALRVVAELASAELALDAEVTRCRVVSFGLVPWNKHQKVRVEVFDSRPASRGALALYRDVEQLLPPRRVIREDGTFFWSVPQSPALVARNLLAVRPWWRGFAGFAPDQKLWNDVARYERTTDGQGGGLMEMVERHLGDGPQRAFVAACHEAWRRLLGRVGERARREGLSFPKLVDREFQRLRVAFARAKNAATLRREVTDFWARSGGALPALQDSWQEVMVLLDEKHWQEARDLALLAMASYKPRDKEEADAIEAAVEAVADQPEEKP